MKQFNWLKTLTYLVLCLLALLGNRFSIPFFFGVDFIFGSIFVFIIFGYFGVLAAIPACLLASSYTYLLWNHPYAIVIFVTEFLIVSFLYNRYQKNLVLLSTIFWSAVGLPMVYLFYSLVMGLPIQSVILIMLKQSVNGIFNVFVAFIVINFFPLVTVLSKKETGSVSFRNVMFTLMLASLILPAMAILIFLSRNEFYKIEKTIVRQLNSAGLDLEENIEDWLGHKVHAVTQVARQISDQPRNPTIDLQNTLKLTAALHPDFHNMFLIGADGITTAFFPPVNSKGESTIGLDFSDRDYFKSLSTDSMLEISDVFQKKGGVLSPLVTISTPIVKNRSAEIALATLKTDHLGDIIGWISKNRIMDVTVVDNKDRIIATTLAGRQILETYDYRNIWDIIEFDDEIYQGFRKSDAALPRIRKWNNSVFLKTFPVPSNSKWIVIIEIKTKPYIEQLNRFYISSLLFIFLLSVVAVSISTLTAAAIVKSIHLVQQASIDLPTRIENGETVNWPPSFIQEVSGLTLNFKKISENLAVSFDKLKEDQFLLEKRVAERTRELSVAVKDLSASHERVKTIINTAQDGIVSIDSRGTVRLFNIAAEQIFQFRAEEVIGNNVKMLIPSPHYEVHDDYIKRYLDTGKAKIIGTGRDVKGKKKDGSQFPMRLNIGEMKLDGDSAFVAVVTDITKQKEIEENLIKSKEASEEANRLKSEFLNTMSHELRTPLTVILGNIEELTDEENIPEADEIAEIGQDVYKASKHLLRLINDLLDISKIEAGRMELARETVNSEEIVRDAFSTIKVLAENRGLALNMLGEHTTLYVDPLRIKQVILNLVANALRFTDEGHVNIVTEPGERDFVLKVQDTGCGMDEDVLKIIFDPFRQADGSSKRKIQGTGLGLAISQKLINLHGGTISVTSKVGEGSEFTISIPIVQAGADE